MNKIEAILESTVTGLLTDFKLRITQCRAEVLTIFFYKDVALSHSDLERKLDNSFGRVTLYRTLKTFVEKGSCTKYLMIVGPDMPYVKIVHLIIMTTQPWR